MRDKLLQKGSNISKVYGNGRYVLAITDMDSSLKMGTMIQIGNEELEIAGILKYNPFIDDGSSDGKVTLITSDETFSRLTSKTGYASLSCLLGCTVGLVLSKWMYDSLITSHYSYAVWKIPVPSLAVILLLVTGSAVLAVYAPAKRIRNISITDTINEL